MSDQPKSVRVVVTDTSDGQILKDTIVDNDYLLITAGEVHVKSIQTMGRTHMIAVGPPKKGSK